MAKRKKFILETVREQLDKAYDLRNKRVLEWHKRQAADTSRLRDGHGYFACDDRDIIANIIEVSPCAS